MWFLDKRGNGINAGQLLALKAVESEDGDGWVVRGISPGIKTAEFAVDEPMTEDAAGDLLIRMLAILGTTDLS